MNQQEIFDFTARHLFEQGKQSAREPGGTCLYRGPDGLKCAVGAHIPDDKYLPGMDEDYDGSGTGFQNLVDEFRDYLPNYVVDRDNSALFIMLQNTHDQEHHWNSTESMKDRLRFVAHESGLNDDVLNECKFSHEQTSCEVRSLPGSPYKYLGEFRNWSIYTMENGSYMAEKSGHDEVIKRASLNELKSVLSDLDG